MSVDFSDLPESVDANELAGYFRNFIELYGKDDCDLFSLNQLQELAYRQWDTYESLDPEIAAELNKYIIGGIDFNDYKIMDVALSIVENLSLRDAFRYITDNKDKTFDPRVTKLIEDAEEEYSDTIDNPFELF